MKDNGLLFSYYDISYETDLGLTERLSQALQELAQGWVLEKVDTIDSLASKTGIRPLLMIGLIRSKGNASPLREMLEEKKRSPRGYYIG